MGAKAHQIYGVKANKVSRSQSPKNKMWPHNESPHGGGRPMATPHYVVTYRSFGFDLGLFYWLWPLIFHLLWPFHV